LQKMHIPDQKIPNAKVGIHEGSTRSRERVGGCDTVRDVVEA
jgi:hypothetical protein